MCDTCPCKSTSSIPGPVEVATSKLGRRILFWGVCIPALPFAIWGEFGWWLVPIGLGLAAMAAGVLAVTRVMHRLAVQARPEPTHEMRTMLAARGLRPIPAPVQLARPALPRRIALPRNLSISGKRRRALPAPARALPAAVVTGRVVEEPVKRAAR